MPSTADMRATYASSLAFIPSREELPILLNDRRLLGCGVEVGVKEGDFSNHLLSFWLGRHLISVDPWSEAPAESYVDIANVSQAQHDVFFERTVERLSRFGDRSSVWRMTSVEGSQLIPHHSLDFVYIDARHDYDSVMEDLEAWYDKVRPGGIIAGHDYLDDENDAGSFQVKMAVDRFFAARGLAVHHTLFDDPWLTWLVEVPLVETAVDAEQPVGGKSPALSAAPGSATPNDADRQRSRPGGGREVTLRLALASGEREFRLRLDDSQMSQRMMLECFDRNQLYEAETSHFMATVLRPGDAFIDVGTHVGYFSMLAASIVGPGGTVISFEPEPENYKHLLSHVELNGFSQVAPINAAVGASTGKAEFHINGDNDGGHALWEVGLHPFNQRSREKPTTRTVDLVSLDDILRGLEVLPRVIKIDVEGAEHSVLMGARETLQTRPVPFIVAEINRFGLERMGTSEKAVRQFMGELGYETYAFDPEGGRIIRLGESDSIESDFVFNLVFRHPAAEAA